MGRVTTPRIITPEIRELCRSISEHEPVFVAVNIDLDSLINECFYKMTIKLYQEPFSLDERMCYNQHRTYV